MASGDQRSSPVVTYARVEDHLHHPEEEENLDVDVDVALRDLRLQHPAL